MKNLFMILAILVSAMFVTSCNLLRGAGQDIENVGDSIQDAAN